MALHCNDSQQSVSNVHRAYGVSLLSVDQQRAAAQFENEIRIRPSQVRPGLPERQTHDYERHGTTTLL
jgi:hypothetical protein